MIEAFLKNFLSKKISEMFLRGHSMKEEQLHTKFRFEFHVIVGGNIKG